ncbi:helix-turn-helix domain-containing protein [Nocardia fluminea]|uniref:helix-turn-helix domain-containing protein n=1 Tax=Nocardia fluminea TaxID=134984 RepID=UPI003D099A09
MLRAAREAAGVGLREVSRRTHYSATYLSDIERGKRPVPADVVAAYETALGADMERLTAVSRSPSSVDTTALDDVAVMLSATRRIEDTTGPVVVLPAVRGVAEMTETFADQARIRAAGRAASLASEVAQYQGWLEHATGAGAAARRSFRKAVELAQESGDADRLAHGLSFHAYADLERGDHVEAAALSEAVLSLPGVHPLLRVYEQFQRARVHAAADEPQAAQHRLVLADSAAQSAEDEPRPDSGYWYTAGFFGLQRARVLRLLGQDDRARDEVRSALAALPDDHRSATWATKWRQAADGTTDVPQ